MAKRELKCSLQTGYLPQARSKAMIMGGRYKQLFRWVRYQQTMGKMTKLEIQKVVDLFIDYIGDADISGERAVLDTRAFPPEHLRDKINKAKDAVLHYKQAADTGDYSGGIRIDLVVDDILNHTVENPPAKGTPEYKILCRKAAEALRDKWDAYQKHHTERLAGVFNAVSDGALVPQIDLRQIKGYRCLKSSMNMQLKRNVVGHQNQRKKLLTVALDSSKNLLVMSRFKASIGRRSQSSNTNWCVCHQT